jgi:hypothetical protein
MNRNFLCFYDRDFICEDTFGDLPECDKCFTNIEPEFASFQKCWQLCPKCNGQGVVQYPPGLPVNETILTCKLSYECDLCKGEKIINIFTGEPPKSVLHEKSNALLELKPVRNVDWTSLREGDVVKFSVVVKRGEPRNYKDDIQLLLDE